MIYTINKENGIGSLRLYANEMPAGDYQRAELFAALNAFSISGMGSNENLIAKEGYAFADGYMLWNFDGISEYVMERTLARFNIFK